MEKQNGSIMINITYKSLRIIYKGIDSYVNIKTKRSIAFDLMHPRHLGFGDTPNKGTTPPLRMILINP